MPKRLLRVVSHSSRSTFLSCKQKYGFRYVDGLRPKVEAPYFAFGRAFHEGVAEGIRQAFRPSFREKPIEERAFHATSAAVAVAHAEMSKHRDNLSAISREGLISEEKFRNFLEKCDEQSELIEEIVKRYIDCTKSQWEFMEPLAIEVPFKVPVLVEGRKRASMFLEGVIDVVWKDLATGDYVIDDHKTTNGSVSSLDGLIGADTQMTGYAYGLSYILQKSGSEAPSLWRCRYNILRKKKPVSPRVLKNGKVSSDRRQDTTHELYEEALVAQEKNGILRSEDQTDFLSELKEKKNPWFAQREFSRTSEDLQRFAREVEVDGKEMRRLFYDRKLWTRNLGHCTSPGRSCEYSSICEYWSPFEEIPSELLEAFEKKERKSGTKKENLEDWL